MVPLPPVSKALNSSRASCLFTNMSDYVGLNRIKSDLNRIKSDLSAAGEGARRGERGAVPSGIAALCADSSSAERVAFEPAQNTQLILG